MLLGVSLLAGSSSVNQHTKKGGWKGEGQGEGKGRGKGWGEQVRCRREKVRETLTALYFLAEV